MGLAHPAHVDLVPNHDGWNLELRVYRDRDRLERGLRPVVFVPGYAMNTYILGFHPGGDPMVASLVAQGFEVWTANLRGQGGSRPVGRPGRYGLAELSLDDLPVVFDHVLQMTETGADRLDPVGCSLGASLVYAYMAHHTHSHPFGAVVSIGGPLRWEVVHPLLRVAFSSGRLAGAVPIVGTRRLARAALPLVRHAPSLLSIYMNAHEIDLSVADRLVNTVDDPVPWINRQVARWVRSRDLVVRGVNVTHALAAIDDLDVLCILANADGIVPPEAARSIAAALGPDQVEVLEVGTAERWAAHADLFIGPRAGREVFEPMGAWLRARNEA